MYYMLNLTKFGADDWGGAENMSRKCELCGKNQSSGFM